MGKHRILFVDDDILILRGIKRSTEEYLDNWEIEYVDSGKEALNLLVKTPFDAIITDMHMPVMDGLTLLDAVNKNFPEVLRYVLSGNASDIQMMRSTHLVHQMFPKPCEMERVYEVVERSCRLRDMFSAPNLIRIITGIKNLPSMPSLYNRILKVLQSEDPSPKLVGDIIAQDAAMTAKILHLVNSAFFGLADNISSPQRAVTILGLNTVKALVLSNHVFSEYQDKTKLPISIDSLWKHSVMVSVIARKLAADLHLTAQEQEDAQVSGILHDIGILLELKIPDFFTRVVIKEGHISVKSEYQILGTSHAEMGAYLLGIWGLPAHIVEAVMLHHKPGIQVSEKNSIITALHISNGLLNMCNFEKDIDYDSYLDIDYLKKMGIVERLDNWTQYIKGLIQNTQSNF